RPPAVSRAGARAEGRGFPAALSGAGRDTAPVRGAGSVGGRHCQSGFRRGAGAQGADPGGPQRVQAAPGADRPSSDAARLWSRSAAADYGQVGVGGVTASRRDEHRLVHVIELVLDVPGKLDVPGSSTLLGGCSGGCLGGASTGSSTSSSWCSTFPGSSTFPGVLRFREARCSREWGVRGCLGGTSTGSSASSSWCSTFPGNATRKLDAPRW